MKKLLSIILSFVLLVSSLGVFTASADVSITIGLGDVNASGMINNKDLGLLMQYLNDWEVDGFFVAAADVNDDDSVNNKDYGLLMQYVNGWDVTLGAQNGNIAGKTIRFASTIDPAHDESGPVVEKFEKEYGVTVEIVLCTLDGYLDQMQALIASGNSPDVVRSNGDFPAFLAYTQSLDAAKLDYTDPIWDQNMFEMTTFDGSPYLCNTVGNIWAEQDIVVYSKSLLARANCYTPEEYDSAGKWTWDAFFEIARGVSKLGDGTQGGYVSPETALHTMDGNVFSLEDGKIVNGIDSNAHTAMTKFAAAWKDGIIGWNSAASGLTNGILGIATASSWALKKTGSLFNAKWNDIGFYYLPRNSVDSDYTSTGFVRGWGIARGAKEPVAAGIFLREYLDVNNYDINSIFISDQATTFFFRMSDINYDNYNPYFTYLGLNEDISGIDYSEDIYSAMYLDPAQVATSMAAVKVVADKGATNMNKFIEHYTGLN